MRLAETWTEVGVHPLRRRDRAAMVLALECLRASDEPPHVALQRAETILDAPGYDGRARSQVWNALCAAQRGGLPGEWLTVQRLLRARLALLLRVLLRIDAGDYGPWLWWPEEMIVDSTCGEFGGVRPLWERRSDRGRWSERQTGAVVA